jgi:hypothetical protein
MKRLNIILILALAAGAVAVAPGTAAAAQGEERSPARADHASFYEALAPFGAWIQLSPYGEVWVPDDVTAGWRPYTEGQWLLTDAGWTWASDFDWGWAPFHYGRWVYDEIWGWVWVPGDVWGPGWVSWRFGGDLIGWAPLPPEAVWFPGIGLRDFDADHIRGSAWVFVDQDDFARGHLRDHVVPFDRDDLYLRRTRVIPGLEVENGRVFNRGIDAERLEQATHHPIDRYVLAEGRQERTEIRGRDLNIYRPTVRLDAHPPQGFADQQANRAELMRRHFENRRELLARQHDELQQLQQRRENELRRSPQGQGDAVRSDLEAEQRQIAELHRQQRRQLLQDYDRELLARRLMSDEQLQRRQLAEQHMMMAQRPLIAEGHAQPRPREHS